MFALLGSQVVLAKRESGFQPIPTEQVLSLVSESTCGCIALPRAGPHVQENILFSTGAADGPALIRVGDEMLSLPRKGSSKGRKTFVNEYGDRASQLVTRTRYANYKKICNAYPDPPTEGSCFVGTMTARVKGQTIVTNVVQICGCP